MCLGTGREAKDVGISTRRGARCACPLSRARGVREVSATCDGDGVLAEHSVSSFLIYGWALFGNRDAKCKEQEYRVF